MLLLFATDRYKHTFQFSNAICFNILYYYLPTQRITIDNARAIVYLGCDFSFPYRASQKMLFFSFRELLLLRAWYADEQTKLCSAGDIVHVSVSRKQKTIKKKPFCCLLFLVLCAKI